MYFVINKAVNKQYFFTIKANNHETLCHSETYTTKQNAQKAIAIIVKEAGVAPIKDQT